MQHARPLNVDAGDRIVTLNVDQEGQINDQRRALAEMLSWDDTTYLVVPSISIEPGEIRFIQRALVDYEHRMLWLLRRALGGRRVIFVSALPVSPMAVGHMISSSRATGYGHMSVETLSLEDASPLPLADKILCRPDWIERLKQAVRGHRRCVLVPFMGTSREFELGRVLGIPVAATMPSLNYLGTKSGSRRVFRKEGLLMPDGYEDLSDEQAIVECLDELWMRDKSRKRLVVKVNEGISGYGNGVVLLPQDDPGDLSPRRRKQLLAARLVEAQFQSPLQNYEFFMSRIASIGGIVEDFIEGERKASPSGQGFIHPTGDVELLSTHEQILSGPNGMVFDGAMFPAVDRKALGAETIAVGEALMEEGAVGYYGVDFLAAGGKRYAIEINLRMGGTTHLRAEAMLSTGAVFDPGSGFFRDDSNLAYYYVGTDTIIDRRLKCLTAPCVLERLSDCQLVFKQSNRTGVLLHLLDSIPRSGILGFTAVAHSRTDSRRLYRRTMKELHALLSERRQ